MSSTYSPHQYEYTYGIGLLDDIHNLFPELLYDTHIYNNSTHRLLQTRTQTLFPREFSHSLAHYRLYQLERRRREAGVAPPPPLPTARVPFRASRFDPDTAPLPIPRTPLRQIRPGITVPAAPPRIQRPAATTTTTTMNIPLNQLGSLFGVEQTGSDITTTFMTALLGGMLVEPIPADLSPVLVTPTSDEIQRATIVTSLQPAADVVCTVCQDRDLTAAPEWRILRPCGHRFHRSCIDPWFQQNVHCPVCRYDIRDYDEASDGEEASEDVSFRERDLSDEAAP